MKLKDDDILRVGDVVHYDSGETLVVGGFSGTSVIDFLSNRSGERREVKKITRESPRVSRKEYKRRIKLAIEYIDGRSTLWTSEVLKIAEILRGEE